MVATMNLSFSRRMAATITAIQKAPGEILGPSLLENPHLPPGAALIVGAHGTVVAVTPDGRICGPERPLVELGEVRLEGNALVARYRIWRRR